MVTATGSKTGDWCNDSTRGYTSLQCRFDSGVPHTKTKQEDDKAMNVLGKEKQIAVIVKEYASPAREDQRKYSPATLVSVYKSVVNGVPNPAKVCTSYIERANLTMRLHCKRLARLTLAFSKKFENFRAAVALHLAYYNFVNARLVALHTGNGRWRRINALNRRKFD